MPELWAKLVDAITDAKEITIFLHDDPDPDAVATGAALRVLLEETRGLKGRIFYRGVIGRAENRALVDYMGVELEVLDEGADVTEHVRGAVALIDTQPGFGNSPLDKDFPVTICIDHHGNSGDNGHVRFRDVRPWIGASSTILTQYYQAAQVEPSTAIATALFYGIKTDTKSLSRDTSAADIGAYFYLLKYVDVDAVVEIETAEVPADYFRSLNRAIQAARVIDGVVTCFLGAVAYPDLTAEVADMFLRLEGVNWVICSSEFEDDLYVSVRARDADADADGLAQEIVGQEGTAGGRNTLAGGQIPLNGSDQDAEEAAALVHRRALAALGIAPDMPGESLI